MVLTELVLSQSSSKLIAVEIDLHRIRIVYRAEAAPTELRFEADGTTDIAQWFTRRDLSEIQLVELGELGTTLAWSE